MNANDSTMPESLIEAVRLFSDLDFATAFFAALRWPSGVCCPRCGSVNVLYLASRRVWECRENHAKKQFSVKIGTIFEECRLPIDNCLIAVWLEVNAKNSISSHELARHLKVTQKTAWFLQHRIRLALNEGTFDKMTGTVEADETFVGGGRGSCTRETQGQGPRRCRQGGGYGTAGAAQRKRKEQGSHVRCR